MYKNSFGEYRLWLWLCVWSGSMGVTNRGERIVFWGPNTNTNIIRVPKNDRIRIRILFGLKKSPEYEYEYYSVWKYQPNTNTNILVFEYYSNNIQIPNYSLTSGIKACKGTLLCSKTKYKGIQKDNLFPESPNRVYFLLVPTQYVPSVVEWMIKSLQKVKVRVKTSHLIFG